jgi:hypothetical protein
MLDPLSQDSGIHGAEIAIGHLANSFLQLRRCMLSTWHLDEIRARSIYAANNKTGNNLTFWRFDALMQTKRPCETGFSAKKEQSPCWEECFCEQRIGLAVVLHGFSPQAADLLNQMRPHVRL